MGQQDVAQSKNGNDRENEEAERPGELRRRIRAVRLQIRHDVADFRVGGRAQRPGGFLWRALFFGEYRGLESAPARVTGITQL